MSIRLQLALLYSMSCVALACSDAPAPDAERASAASSSVASKPAVPGAEVVITQANVHQNEAFWPAVVALTTEWRPAGETKPLQAQWRGNLIRVEADGRVRIDFGRHGSHEVPIDHTNLVERANEVREGTRTKLAQNFVLLVGTRLVDSSSQELRAHKTGEIAGARAYLCIFADPRAEDFPVFAREIAALEGINGVRTVFFPQSVTREDLGFVHQLLGKLFWQVPFMYPRMSESYTLSLIDEIPERPQALLVSPEGRLIHRADLGLPSSFDELRQAVER